MPLRASRPVRPPRWARRRQPPRPGAARLTPQPPPGPTCSSCARAFSAGQLSREGYARLSAELLQHVRERASGIDAMFFSMHGAMVAEHRDDGEGHLLVLVREMVGPDVPVVASLDLHANVSDTMLAQAKAALA